MKLKAAKDFLPVISRTLLFLLSGAVSICNAAISPISEADFARGFYYAEGTDTAIPSSATPCADSLREEFNNRWFNSKVPDFLETRRAGEDAAYAGPTLPASEYLAILQSDGETPPGKISELVNPDIYSSLQHQMKSKWLVSLLREGRLLPRSGSYWVNDEGNSAPGVYLELHRHANPKPFAWGDVELHFDYSLLDRDDYLINPFWDYGAYTPFSASPAVSPGRVAFYIRNYFLNGDANEVVFVSPVPLDKLLKIVVPAGRRAPVLQELEKNQISCPGGCATLIEERPEAETRTVLPGKSREN